MDSGYLNMLNCNLHHEHHTVAYHFYLFPLYLTLMKQYQHQILPGIFHCIRGSLDYLIALNINVKYYQLNEYLYNIQYIIYAKYIIIATGKSCNMKQDKNILRKLSKFCGEIMYSKDVKDFSGKNIHLFPK